MITENIETDMKNKDPFWSVVKNKKGIIPTKEEILEYSDRLLVSTNLIEQYRRICSVKTKKLDTEMRNMRIAYWKRTGQRILTIKEEEAQSQRTKKILLELHEKQKPIKEQKELQNRLLKYARRCTY